MNTPAEIFEDAIREFGIENSCEWFGHGSDSEFTTKTIEVLSERVTPPHRVEGENP